MKKIAIVYDWIDKWGGVERVLLALREMFPGAVFYTSVYDKDKAQWAKGFKINTTFIQGLPDIIKKNRVLSIPFYATAFETLDFKDYDLVISVTSSFSKSLVTPPGTKHICYLLTPTRFLWSHQKNYFKNNILTRGFVDYLKRWDLAAASRPDEFISISGAVRERCLKFYHRDSRIVYPPFDSDYWKKIKAHIKSKKSPVDYRYFLVVSRLETYKKVDLVLKAFRGSKHRLVIVGEGSQGEKLRRLADKNVAFFSKLTDHQLASLYSHARALIMPQEEDFGYVSLESQFFGTPVIAYNGGGAKETVVDGKTGIFFDKQSEIPLRQAIARFVGIEYNLRTNTEVFGQPAVFKFDRKIFEKNFKKII